MCADQEFVNLQLRAKVIRKQVRPVYARMREISRAVSILEQRKCNLERKTPMTAAAKTASVKQIQTPGSRKSPQTEVSSGTIVDVSDVNFANDGNSQLDSEKGNTLLSKGWFGLSWMRKYMQPSSSSEASYKQDDNLRDRLLQNTIGDDDIVLADDSV
jgi:hypothetical protein